MSDPDFTRSCYATDADLYKAKAEYYEAKVEEMEKQLLMHSDIDRLVVRTIKKLDQLDIVKQEGE